MDTIIKVALLCTVLVLWQVPATEPNKSQSDRDSTHIAYYEPTYWQNRALVWGLGCRGRKSPMAWADLVSDLPYVPPLSGEDSLAMSLRTLSMNSVSYEEKTSCLSAKHDKEWFWILLDDPEAAKPAEILEFEAPILPTARAELVHAFKRLVVAQQLDGAWRLFDEAQREKSHKTASRAFRTVIERFPEEHKIAAVAQLMLGLTEGKESSADSRSISALRRVVEEYPRERARCFVAQYHIADTFETRGKPEEAKSAWEALLGEYLDFNKWNRYVYAKERLRRLSEAPSTPS